MLTVLIVMFYLLPCWVAYVPSAEKSLLCWVLQISPLMLSVIMLGVTFYLLLCWASFLLSVANELFMLSIVMLIVIFYLLYADCQCASCDVFSIAMLGAENKLFMLSLCWMSLVLKKVLNTECHFFYSVLQISPWVLLCWVSHFIYYYPERHFCWALQMSPLCWMSWRQKRN